MKYPLYIFIALFVGFMFYFGIFGAEKLQENGGQPTVKPLNNPQSRWETKIDEQPPVSIAATPIEFGKDATTWKFDVSFDTHSGSLDQDPMKVISLLDDNGNAYQPIAWEGDPPGGHHREGVIIFNAINQIPSYVELVIKNVGGVAERIFIWRIK